jgi:hypothetical protein
MSGERLSDARRDAGSRQPRDELPAERVEAAGDSVRGQVLEPKTVRMMTSLTAPSSARLTAYRTSWFF